jgi:hypothetical protein
MTNANGQAAAEVRRLLRIALQVPATAIDLDSAELDLLIRLLRQVRLHGRFAVDLQKAGVFKNLPQVAQDQLQSVLVMAEARKRVALWELDRIGWATRDHPNIDLICMKGCAYILLNLPNTPGRIFADVDLVLPEADLPRLEQLLNRRGWKTQELSPYDDNYYRRWTHELPPLMHRERDVEIDLHHNIVPRTARLKPAGHKLVERAQPLEGARYRVLANEDLVLHAMVHLMFDSDLVEKLRDLVDIDNLCRYFAAGDAGFWDSLLERADEQGLGRPLYYSLRYGQEFLGTPVPEKVVAHVQQWAPVAPIRWMMDRCAPLALLPEHPDHTRRGVALARLLLYMRSHWLRMPPWLLAYHLAYKFYVIRFRGGGHSA